MTRSTLSAFAGTAIVAVASVGMLSPGPTRAADAGTAVTIALPADASAYKPGPGSAVVTAQCSACHGAAYVYTQPKLTRAAWTAEVTKMRKAYGAPVPDDDVAPIVDYLVSQNGRE